MSELKFPPIEIKENSNSPEFLAKINDWRKELFGYLDDAPTTIAPTLLNSWVDSGSPNRAARYWRGAGSIVHIEGLIKSGTPSSTSVAFILPEGYRPPARLILATIASGPILGRVTITADGEVIIEVGSTTWTSISGITFLAA